MSEKKYLVAITSYVPFGPVRVSLLRQYFGSYESVWKASTGSLIKLGLSGRIVKGFGAHRQNFDIEGYFERLDKLDIKAVCIDSEDYPANLKRITSAPLVLYIRGNIAKSDANAVAIVGTRKMSSYGADVARTFATQLSINGVTIISGLAFGIDAVAHKAALAAGGRTIAVLSGGLDKIYPSANLPLAREIVKRGSAIVSEYPLGYPPLRVNFVMRNRIVSGLSRAVVVVEGRAKSGTLLTASHAAEQGIDVYAVPGPVYSPLSEATNFLLKSGAKLAASPSDILDDLSVNTVLPQIQKESLNDNELNLLSVFDSGPLHIDEVVRMCSGDTCEIISSLSMMEIKGLVKNLGGGVYKKL